MVSQIIMSFSKQFHFIQKMYPIVILEAMYMESHKAGLVISLNSSVTIVKSWDSRQKQRGCTWDLPILRFYKTPIESVVWRAEEQTEKRDNELKLPPNW